ncbi:HMG1/2-like protein [Quercus lobata]|uniref:HMG1/2-like protein n=1 Tax=Quercus lobata TaxID=97700 RepID=UPI0012482712|nr:HMG1/2-like protein [Quercus lobata]XP_030949812.1 HMG1/2-like protein [Quercus lobata]XP_030958984.1 HMG1/2-like protein [Quercus lobata]
MGETVVTDTLLLFPFSVNAIFSGYNTAFFFFLFGRKKSSSTVPKAKKAKTDKKSKDPNAPKRPQTAFFLFMDDFRKTYKEENPDSKGGKEVAKEGGEKWKSLDRKREKYS